MEKFNRLKEILRTMFQLDRGDLDFGLYRIMNMKAAEIADFLDNDLLPQVQDALTGDAQERQADLEKELAKARATARDLGADPEEMPKVKELQEQLAEVKADVAAEADVYNHLANFFARYYDEGDFMSLRRYSGGGQSSYLIPYDGEEVKLHWANADQYYIKSTENYASYVFSVGPGDEKRRVRFEIAKADNEKDNVKEASDKQRRFLLAEGDAVDTIEIVGADLVIRFAHRPLTESEKKLWKGNGSKQQESINKAAAQRILNTLEPAWQMLLAVAAPTENSPERTVLDKHLAAYTAKNSFDYFIHKDLGGFLRRELDLYLKTDVLNLDDLAAGDTLRLQRALARTRAVRHVADKIITFLAQIEEFQKQLWLKKKFVLETQYCVTLDRVPETLYSEIAANKAQHDEWLKLCAIDEIEGDLANGNTGYTHPLTTEFLKTNPYLVLDTRHFGCDFTDRLLAALSDDAPLEEQLDGLLVHGENFQGLNLMMEKYQGELEAIYIDPPYNTLATKIIYKNEYEHSSWLTLLENRLLLARHLLAKDGTVCITIDDYELHRLMFVMENVFGYSNYLATVAIRNNPSGRSTVRGFAINHEYALFFSRSSGGAVVGRIPHTESQKSRYDEIDEDGLLYEWENFRKSSSGSNRSDRVKQYFPLYCDRQTYALRLPQLEWREESRNWKELESPKATEFVIWPIDARGRERVWRYGIERTRKILKETRVEETKDGFQVYTKKYLQTRGSLPRTWWEKAEYSARDNGTRALADLFGSEKHFDFPKAPVAVMDSIRVSCSEENANVLDFFAGSGTTGHAVINLNREEGSERKYILVEVGDHFDTVLLQRIKKVIYSPDWRDGKPVSRNGLTQFFKYIRLESYEDTLDSLELIPLDSAHQDLLAQNPALEEDYRLRYALGQETSGSACLLGKYFTDPFVYTLSVVRDGIRSDVAVDLPETFNFLIGLRSEARRKVEDVLAITGTDAEGRRCLILWRNLEGTDNPALDDWFTRNRESFSEPDIIYANGDHTLNALKQPKESWTAKTIEPIFRELMFKGEES